MVFQRLRRQNLHAQRACVDGDRFRQIGHLRRKQNTERPHMLRLDMELVVAFVDGVQTEARQFNFLQFK